MFVEEQPFGTPDAWNAVKHTYFDGGKGDVRGAKYAAARAAYLRTHKNLWNYFRESSWNRQSWWDRDFWSNFAFCFDLWPELDVVNDVMWRSNRTHNALWNQQLQDIPNIGRSNEDYSSMNDVLQEIVDKQTDVGQFATDDTQKLRGKGHGRTATRYRVSEAHQRAQRRVVPLFWDAATSFGGLLLPCVTAEVSPTEDAGITRVCLPFIQPNPHFDVDEAISSICGVVWVVGRRMGLVEEKEMQIARATHKMKIREESGELWFNKSCKSNRVATTITRNGNSFVYMYLGGGAVGEEQSEIISGIVVICKSWRWSFLVCAACRLVAMTKHNFLGGLEKTSDGIGRRRIRTKTQR